MIAKLGIFSLKNSPEKQNPFVLISRQKNQAQNFSDGAKTFF